MVVAEPEATVFGLPGSNSTWSTRLMLDHKEIGYRLIQLPNVASRGIVRALGFPGPTVPAIRLKDPSSGKTRRLQQNRTIARALEELRPEPRLFPVGAERLREVEEAERWGDEILQPLARRLAFASPARRKARPDYASFFDGPLLLMPQRLAVAVAGPLLAINARITQSDDESIRSDLGVMPALIAHLEDLLDRGVIGGTERNAADFVIAPSVTLLMGFDDLRPELESSAISSWARQVAPGFKGRIRPVFPEDWLAPLRGQVASAEPGRIDDAHESIGPSR